MGETLEIIVFGVLAVFITFFSVMTVITRRVIRSATYLLFVLFATAGIYFLLGYTFLGSVQIMVYTGGIVVLYVFSILLTTRENDRVEKLKRSKILAGLGAVMGGAVIVLFVLLSHRFVMPASTDPALTEISVETVGTALLSGDKNGYVLPFEAVSILLLACIVGGLMIARKR
ncbi:NADH-quinone oxidoreductase subunit J [termite gut metagenome]|uniref:NADH-quinone oxidoreductase subunit J n=1 Tax=termite gut metagenome TaxID=433724 RepID=A0A5J4RYT6_9ZZZZ